MFFLLLAFTFFATVFIAFKLRQRRLGRLQGIADRTGLSLQAGYTGPPELKGDFHGRTLMMTPTTTRRRSGKQRRTVVVVDVKNPEFLRLRMRRQDHTRHPFRAAEFEIGDHAFDGRFFIQSDEPRLVKDVIGHEDVRDALIRSEIYSAQVLGPRLEVVYDGRLEDPSQAEIIFSAAARLADAIDALGA